MIVDCVIDNMYCFKFYVKNSYDNTGFTSAFLLLFTTIPF